MISGELFSKTLQFEFTRTKMQSGKRSVLSADPPISERERWYVTDKLGTVMTAKKEYTITRESRSV